MTDPANHKTSPAPAQPEAEQVPVVTRHGGPMSVIGLIQRQMYFPNTYVWLLLFSAMDIMLTWVILYFGGSEVNPIARWVIDGFGLNGMIVYKFALILVFIGICEAVAALRKPTASVLSKISVLIALVPVVWSLILLSRFSGLIG